MNWKVAKGGERSWQYRVLQATTDPQGVRNLAGVIFRAALRNNGTGRLSYPRFAHKAEINKDGIVVADCASSEAQFYHKVPIESDIAMRDRFRWIADELNLLDWERTELFTCLASWIARDHRIQSILDKDG